MSDKTQHTNATDNEPTDIPSTDGLSNVPPSNEMGWLVPGLLILVLGIGGALMYSQEEDLRVETEKPVANPQLTQAFPAQAMASQSAPPLLQPDATILPVSMVQEGSSPDDEGIINDIEVKEVYFDFDKAVLSGEAKALLVPQAQLIKNENKSILVRGHTDQKGSEAYNNALSLRRAEAVKKYLVSLGLVANSIHVEGLGKAQPICTDSTDDCAAKNRRANLYFPKSDSKVPQSELLISQPTSEADEALIASSQSPSKGTESDPRTMIETVRLSDTAEEIAPTDPIASTTTPQ